MSKAPAIGRTPVHAEGHNSRAPMYRWDGNPARNPCKGEFYISGAIATAYNAHRDIESPFFIAVPVHETVTVAQLNSDVATLAALARNLTPYASLPIPAHRLRTLATHARQLADDADALARHIDITET